MRLLSFLMILLALAGCIGDNGAPGNAKGANAFLSDLVISAGDFDQPFRRDVRGYNSTVPNNVTSIQLTPVVEDTDATVEINGKSTPANSASAPVDLVVGENLIDVKIIAQDGTTRVNYTVTITREPSENAFLSGIQLSSSQINENFLAGQYSYTANVASDVTELRLTPTSEDDTATIVVNGLPFSSGQQSQPIPLFKGSNVISVMVTAQNGRTKKAYSLIVERGNGSIAPLATSANLSDLTLSSGLLDQSFNSLQRQYTQTVANGVFQVQVTATPTDSNSWITVNGVDVVSGQPSQYINLALGENIINVVVKSEDGYSQKTYTIIVNRLAKANALLSDVQISSGILSPEFHVGVSQFNATVDNSVSEIIVTPVSQDVSAQMWVNGQSVLYGQSSAAVALNVGSNNIPIKVTAEDGVTSRDYTLQVSRQGNAVVNLSGLTLSSGTLSPTFSADTKNYTATVANGVTSIDLTATAADASNVLTINDVSVTNGVAYNLPLTVGKNDARIKLVSSDGKTSNQYKLTITRDGTTTPDLLDLGVIDGSVQAKASFASGGVATVNLLSGFSAGTTIYNISVGYDTSSIQISPVAQDAGATITVNGVSVLSGQASQSIPLTAGSNNAVNVVVTSSDGTSNKTYLIAVFREGNNNAELASLSLGSLSYTPGFHAGTTEYSAEAAWNTSSVTITPVLVDSGASVKVNGVVTPSGSPYNVSLLPGVNTIPIEVTAQDYSTKRLYNVSINVDYGTNADLSSLILSNGTLSPTFDGVNTVSYTASVSYETASITVLPELDAVDASVKVNGVTVTSGTPSADIPLSVGANTIITQVTSADGSLIRNYTVTVTREASTDASLADLQVSAGNLSPLFVSDVSAYSVNVGNEASSIIVTPVTSDAGATVQVTANGSVVPDGSEIQLNVGVNNISVLVTAADGQTQRSYSLVVSRTASGNASLSTILLPQNTGSLSPVFSGNNYVYTVTVPYDVVSISLAPYATDANATIKVNGLYVASGSYSPATALNVGSNYFEIVVTAEDEVSQVTYLVTVDRQSDYGKVYLTNLIPSDGVLSPAFDSGITSYTVEVDNDVTEFTVMPITNFNNIEITVNGWSTPSGTFSPTPVPLNVGVASTVSTVISLEDGTFKTYNIYVTRRANNNADVVALAISDVKLQPAFNKDVFTYNVKVPYHVATVSATAILDDSRASLAINGSSATSGVAVGPIALAVGGGSLINTVATAEDGTQKSYKVYVNRNQAPLADNANLFDMVPSTGSLDSTFDPAQTSYNMSVGYLTSSMRFTSKLEDIAATLKVNGNVVADSELSPAVVLQEGNNQVQLEVTARDGVTKKLYTVNIARQTSNQFAAQAYLKASNTSGSDWFGSAVAVSGKTVVVGAQHEDGNVSSDGIVGGEDNNLMSNAGAAYVFELDAFGNWVQTAYLKPESIGRDFLFGYGVAIDGDTLVVGAPGDNASSMGGVNPVIDGNGLRNAGAAYVYVRDNGTWKFHTRMTTATELGISDWFGRSVDIHEDTIIVGSVGDDSNSTTIINGETSSTNYSASNAGSAHVFVRDALGNWKQQAYLKPSNAGAGDQFGTDVAIHGDTAVVGALYEDTSGGDSGAAYVFKRDAQGQWSQQAMLKADNAGGGDRFGQAVSVYGDTVAVGAIREDTDGTDSGAVYVFVRDGAGNWTQQAMVKSSNLNNYDLFGSDVDIHGDTLVIGALSEDGKAYGVSLSPGAASVMAEYTAQAGAVYVYTRQGSVWTQKAYVKATNTGPGDNFGQYLATDGETLVVGGHMEDGGAIGVNGADNNLVRDSGAAYIYR